MKKLVLPVLLYLLCAGNTDCADFSQVPVPAVDATTPTVWSSIWRNGQRAQLTASQAPLTTWWGLSESMFIVHAATDGSGIRELRTWHRYQTTCCTAAAACTTTHEHLPDAVATQAGAVGSMVSNGLYTLEVLRQPVCPPGTTLWTAGYFWQTQATDFHDVSTRGPQNAAAVAPRLQ